MEAITTAVTSALTTMGSDAMTMIATVLPGALAVAGALIVTKLGIKAFRSIAK